jgi:stage V sporulation protein G
VEITEVRIKLMDDPSERLRAFCSVTFDNSFVVRDLKIIEGTSGPFVAMPSRKLTAHCNRCGAKNHLRAIYCNQCGTRIQREHSGRSDDGRAKLYADIAHPINSPCREMIQSRVVEAYHEELEKAKQPGYVSRYDDYDDDIDVEALGPPAPHHATNGPNSMPAPMAASTVSQGETRAVPAGASNGNGAAAPSLTSNAATPHSPQRATSAASDATTASSDNFGAGVFG